MLKLKDGKWTLLGIGVAAALALVLGLMVSGGAQAQEVDHGGAMSLAADGSGVDCSGGECIVDEGSDFTLTVVVDESTDAGYIGLGTQVHYQSLTYSPATPAEEVVIDVDDFPGILLRAPPDPTEGMVTHGMTAGSPPAFTTSMYTGPIVELAMTCTEQYTRNDVALAPWAMDNTLGSGFKLPVTSGNVTVSAGDTLTVHCGDPPTPTPGPSATAPAGDLPSTGTGLESDSGSGLWIAIVSLVAAGAAAGAGALAWRRVRQ